MKKLLTTLAASVVFTTAAATIATAAPSLAYQEDVAPEVKAAATALLNNVMADGKVTYTSTNNEYKYCVAILQSGITSSKVTSMKKSFTSAIQSQLSTDGKIDNALYELYAIRGLQLMGKDSTKFTAGSNTYNLASDFSKTVTAENYKELTNSYSYSWCSYLMELPSVKKIIPSYSGIENKLVSLVMADTGEYSFKETKDIDTLATGIIAMTPYKNKSNVSTDYNNSLSRLKTGINKNGTYSSSWSGENASTTGLALHAAADAGIASTLKGSNGTSILDGLLTFRLTTGGFKATATDTKTDVFSDYDALCGLMAYKDSCPQKTSIKKASISGVEKSYIYTGKVIKPTVKLTLSKKTLKKDTDYKVTYKDNKNTGKAVITITGKGAYKGTLIKSFYITPKQAQIASLSSPSTKKLTVTWKKAAGKVTGYEVRISHTKGFKKYSSKLVKASHTTYTKSSLTAGRTCYVKVRAYKTVGSKKIYGTYSPVKTVKVK